MKKRKEKVEVLYTVDLDGKEFDGPANLAFYDIIKDTNCYIIRYYGCCAVHTSLTFEEAKAYIAEKAEHVMMKRRTNEQGRLHKRIESR